MYVPIRQLLFGQQLYRDFKFSNKIVGILQKGRIYKKHFQYSGLKHGHLYYQAEQANPATLRTADCSSLNKTSAHRQKPFCPFLVTNTHFYKKFMRVKVVALVISF